jgi:hypothetical protein
VISVPRSPVRAKSDQNLGTNAANSMDKIRNRAVRWNLIQGSVGITEDFTVRDLQNFASGTELRTANLRQFFSGIRGAPAARLPAVREVTYVSTRRA